MNAIAKSKTGFAGHVLRGSISGFADLMVGRIAGGQRPGKAKAKWDNDVKIEVEFPTFGK